MVDAVGFTDYGMRVFPLAKGTKNQPLIKAWQINASADPDQVGLWWDRYGNCNIGFLTNGCLILDVDVEAGGDAIDHPWLTEERVQSMYDTGCAVVRTPRGGLHFYFRQPADRAWRNSTGDAYRGIANGVDTRADGGYILLPGSQRPEGSYTYIVGHTIPSPVDSWPEPPGWLITLCDRFSVNGAKPREVATNGRTGGRLIQEPGRDNELFRRGRAMRGDGDGFELIKAKLAQLNAERCVNRQGFKEPLPDKDIARIAKSAAACSVNEGDDRDDGREPGFKSFLEFESAADVVESPIEFLWQDKLIAGEMHQFAGDGGSGKSTLGMWMSSMLANGGQWPDGTHCPVGNSGWISAEETIDRPIIAKLLDNGYRRHDSPGNVYVLKAVRDRGPDDRAWFCMSSYLTELEEAIDTLDLAMLWIDPAGSYIGKVDSHSDGEVNAMLAPLSEIARRQRCLIALVRHFNKTADTDPVLKISGSKAWTNHCRMNYVICADKGTPGDSLMVPVKSNLIKNPTGLRFRTADDSWRIQVDAKPVTKDDGLATMREGPSLKDATDWLICQLEDGPVERELLQQRVKSEPFSWPAVCAAKDKLHVQIIETGKGRTMTTSWEMPRRIRL